MLENPKESHEIVRTKVSQCQCTRDCVEEPSIHIHCIKLTWWFVSSSEGASLASLMINYKALDDRPHTPILVAGARPCEQTIWKQLPLSPPHIFDFSLPEKPTMELGSTLRVQINYALAVLRDIASGREVKKFLMVKLLADCDAAAAALGCPGIFERDMSTI